MDQLADVLDGIFYEEKGQITVRQRIRKIIDERDTLDTRVDVLLDQIDHLTNVVSERNKTMDDYLNLIQAVYDFNAETGEWHFRCSVPKPKPIPMIPVGSRELRKLDLGV